MVKIGNNLTLRNIVKYANTLISLPNVQRSFVWKPHQIENLWDSLLRGYPIGSFVLSPNLESMEKWVLLDGQQRASAICLGFSDGKFFKTSSDDIVRFRIDGHFSA